MEKKTIDTLHVMLCREIEDIAKQGKLSHESLDILKDLLETEKNLVKIEKYDEEKKEKEEMRMGGGGMSMDGGYSQRKYYIDADYQPYGQSNARGGSYMGGGNYARAGQGGGGASRAGGQGGSSRMGMYDMYDMGGSYMDGGNSYNMYYDPRYDMSMYARRGGQGGNYARASGKSEMIEELQRMMGEAQDETVKKAIQEAITKMSK